MDNSTFNFFTILISLASLAFSLFNFHKDRVFKKTTTETEIFNVISNAQSMLSASNKDMGVFDGDDSQLITAPNQGIHKAFKAIKSQP